MIWAHNVCCPMEVGVPSTWCTLYINLWTFYCIEVRARSELTRLVLQYDATYITFSLLTILSVLVQVPHDHILDDTVLFSWSSSNAVKLETLHNLKNRQKFVTITV